MGRWPRILPCSADTLGASAAVLTALLGVVVIAAWHARSTFFLQVNPAFVPIQYNTALAFLLCSAGILAARAERQAIAAVCGAIVTSAAILNLCEEIFAVNLGIDTALFTPFVNTAITHPGRMAPNTAICLALIGLSLLMSRSRVRAYLAIAVSLVTGAVGTVALFGYLSGMEAAYAWGYGKTQMAVPTAAGIALLALALFCLGRRYAAGGFAASRWMPVLAGIPALTLSLLLWSALIIEQKIQLGSTLDLAMESIKDQTTAELEASVQALELAARNFEAHAERSAQAEKHDTAIHLKGFRRYALVGWIDRGLQVRWIIRGEGSERIGNPALGTDGEIRRDLEALSRSGQSAIGPLTSIAGRRFLQVRIPLFPNGRFGGLMVGLLPLDQLLAARLRGTFEKRYSIITSINGESAYQAGRAGGGDSLWMREANFPLWGSVCRIRIWARPELVFEEKSHLTHVVLVVCVIMVSLLVLAFHLSRMAQRRADEAQALAKDLQASEQTVRSQSAILEAVLSQMADGVVVADQNARITFYNAAAQQIMGMGVQESEPERWAETYGLFESDKRTPYPFEKMPMIRALQGEIVDGAELYVRNPSLPEGAWISAAARPLRSQNGTRDQWGGVVVFRDITEAKRTQDFLTASRDEAQNANRAKSEFLSRMSHELRTPLNAILGFAQVLEIERALTSGQSESVEQILKAGRHLLALINEVLDIAKVESGRLALSAEPVNVLQAIQEALDLVRPLAAEREVWLENFDRGPELFVVADRQRLHQVLLNLLSNAVKYNSHMGRVQVSVEQRGAANLRIRVEDTGPGIDAQHLPSLFSPFERIGAEHGDIEGTGLGLAVSKSLCAAMGGDIGVESVPGQGSTFWIEFPSVPDPLSGTVEQVIAAEEEGPRPDVSGVYSMLYIEDNLSNIKLMEHVLLLRPEVRLLSTTRGAAGLAMARESRPDIVFLDLHLPDMNGAEVLRQLRLDSATAATPVVIVTADATARQMEGLKLAGANDYVTKPIEVNSLLRLLDQLLLQNCQRTPEFALSETSHERQTSL